MKINIRRVQRSLALLTLAGSALLAGAARADNSLPIYDAGGVLYVSGGIGQDEAKFLRGVQANWPASFEFAARVGQKSDYVAGVVVSVFDMQRRLVLDKVVSDGPMLLAALPPGRYQVQATLAGRTLTRDIQVPSSGTAHSVFLWPAGTDTNAGAS